VVDGCDQPKGYGVFGLGARREGTALAHRVAWYLAYGCWPAGILRHDCDTPPCVWTDHLIDGTLAQNTADMLRRGRGVPPPIHRGEAANAAKLKEHQILEIRELLRESLSRRVIADRYGVSKSLITQIALGQCWSWLESPEGM
jgi:hypothetical protein